jgi:phosphoribosylformylglycinamidine cyclo-ligase
MFAIFREIVYLPLLSGPSNGQLFSAALPTTYAKSGVSISEGDRFVRLIKNDVRTTFTPRVLKDIGAFGAFFDARFRGMRSPVLVSSVDGVGTKLLVAQMLNRHDTVGQDLVNHCVNDILVCGATPLFFLDYFATGKLDPEVAARVIKGFTKACRENGCSLIGGETAEMPGMYGENEYDLAGTIVGVVERKKIVDGRRVRKGDVVIGLSSTGLHTNGFSLARAVLLRQFALDAHIDELGSSLGDALLAVHRSYLKTVRAVMSRFDIHALSHITGGGIIGNTMRVVPKGRRLKIDWASWKRPALFTLIKSLGGVPEGDMRRTFNLGIGLVMIVPRMEAGDIIEYLKRRRDPGVVLGEVM